MSRHSVRTLIVVSAEARSLDNGADAPRRDFAVVRERLNAQILSVSDIKASQLGRLLMRCIGAPAALACFAFRARADFDVVLTDGEHVGLPFALLLKASRSRLTHVTIGHRITAPKKRALFRWLHPESHIDRIAVHAYKQVERAVSELGLKPEKLALVPYQVDSQFWTSNGREEGRLICSAGLEFRDYPTLFEAVNGLDIEVVVGAASNFSRRSSTAEGKDIPSNVQVSSFNHAELRALYDRSSIVVVPLDDVDFQAGVTTILEAMSMAKPVIVTQTLGQTDVVIDRRWSGRGVNDRPRPLSLLRLLAAEAGIDARPNGLYVAPGDALAMRNAISFLLNNPFERRMLGNAGRELVERLCTPEQFADRLARLINDAYIERVAGHGAVRVSSLLGVQSR